MESQKWHFYFPTYHVKFNDDHLYSQIYLYDKLPDKAKQSAISQKCTKMKNFIASVEKIIQKVQLVNWPQRIAKYGEELDTDPLDYWTKYWVFYILLFDENISIDFTNKKIHCRAICMYKHT